MTRTLTWSPSVERKFTRLGLGGRIYLGPSCVAADQQPYKLRIGEEQPGTHVDRIGESERYHVRWDLPARRWQRRQSSKSRAAGRFRRGRAFACGYSRPLFSAMAREAFQSSFAARPSGFWIAQSRWNVRVQQTSWDVCCGGDRGDAHQDWSSGAPSWSDNEMTLFDYGGQIWRAGDIGWLDG